MSDYGRRPRSGAALLEKVRGLRGAALQDKWDGPAWEQAGLELLNSPALTEDVRMAFEELLNLFPFAGLYWARYLELELNAGNVEEAKNIIGRCLLSCPVLDLWSQYLRFIKKANEGKGPDALAQVRKAYEFTMEQLGLDIGSGPLWQEYIACLRTPKVGTPGFTALFPQAMVGQEESTRMLALRKAYQRAVVVPGHMLEALWKDWEAFETGGKGAGGGGQQGQPQLGRKLIDEWRPRYTAARGVYRERKKRLDLLSATVLPLPPGKGGMLLDTQAALRRDYLDWERSNPQRLDPPAHSARVCLAYDQAMQVLARFPDLWFDYAHWHIDGGGAGSVAAGAVLAKADQAVPNCLLLRFTLADIEEVQGNHDAAKEVYDSLARALEAEASTAGVGQAEAPPAGHSLGWDPEQGGLLWVQYMRFLRRTGGDNAARKGFLRARRWPGCPWHVYAATALAEWNSGRDATVARNLFEKGLEEARHLRNPHYILQYLQFLSDVGDVDNAHSLLERVLGEEANSQSLALWERYIQLELQAGDLPGAAKVEARAREALRMGPREVLALGVRRHRFLDLWPCSSDQQQHLEGLLGLGRGGGGGAAGGGADPVMGSTSGRAADMKLPTQLNLFLGDLPAAHAVDGPVPDIDRVMQVLLSMDLSPSGVAKACVELEARLSGGGAHNGPPGGGGPEHWHGAPPPHHPSPPHPGYGAPPGGGSGPAGPPPTGPPPPYHEDPHAPPGKRRQHPDHAPNGGGAHGYDDDEDDGYGGPQQYGQPGQPDVYRMRLKQQRG